MAGWPLARRSLAESCFAVGGGLGRVILASLLFGFCSAVTAATLGPDPDNKGSDNKDPYNKSESVGFLVGRVEAFHTALLEGARSDLDFDGRVTHLSPEFDQAFDLPRIARISLGSSWRTLEAPVKDEYLQALRDVLLGTYVSRFDEDRGQRLRIIEGLEVKPGKAVVRAQIIRPSGATVSLDYYLRDQRVFNVEAEGVSDLSIRRAQYSSLIKTDGMPALLDHLRAQFASARKNFRSAR